MKLNKLYLLFVIILLTGCSLINLKPIKYHYFDKSIYVITKNVTNDKIKYYEIYGKNLKRDADVFEIDDKNIYYISHNCFEKYDFYNDIEIKNVSIDKCIIKNENNEIIPLNNDLENIIHLAFDIDHYIFSVKIFNIDNDYYVVVELNVNLWSPYELYKYNKENNILDLIYTFDGEDVIGLKLEEINE